MRKESSSAVIEKAGAIETAADTPLAGALAAADFLDRARERAPRVFGKYTYLAEITMAQAMKLRRAANLVDAGTEGSQAAPSASDLRKKAITMLSDYTNISSNPNFNSAARRMRCWLYLEDGDRKNAERNYDVRIDPGAQLFRAIHGKTPSEVLDQYRLPVRRPVSGTFTVGGRRGTFTLDR